MPNEVKFTLRKSPTGKEALVMLRFSYNNRRLQVSTGFSIPVKFWNPGSQRMKETQAFPYHQAINQRLNKLAENTLDLFYEYTAQGIVPTASQFKKDWLKKTSNIQEDAPQAPGVVSFVREKIAERERLNWKKSTLKVYRNCLFHLEAFEKGTGRPLRLDDLNKVFLTDFVAYLYAQGLADDYARKILANLKMFIRLAEGEGLVKDSVLLKNNNPIKSRNKTTFYLNEREIEHLFNLELEGKLANVRDLFLIGCLTGQRFDDFSQIRSENIQPVESEGKTVDCLVITQGKTGQRVTVPLSNPMLLTILERHGWKAPKAISNQKFNDYLKDLARLAGLTRKVEVIEYRAGRQEKEVKEFWEIMASHIARRSFCTNAFKRGIPPATLIKFSGHKDVKTLLTYLRASNEETAVELSEHAFFTGKAPLKVAK